MRVTETHEHARSIDYESGMDCQEIVAVLEREGVEKFAGSFSELIDVVADRRRRLVRA